VIFVERKPEAGREQPVEDGTTIGRDGCDVNLSDDQVSRRHAEIRTSGGSLGIEDLGSTNGTFVNEKRINGLTVLSHGDTVRLGATVWAVSIDDTTAAQPAAAVAEPRGDVEKPPEVAPSAIRRVLPPPAPGRAPAFSPPGAARPSGGSAATRVEATVVCMVIIAAVAIALIVYFATY
jgi:predicted component of type VI protein secretion system